MVNPARSDPFELFIRWRLSRLPIGRRIFMAKQASKSSKTSRSKQKTRSRKKKAVVASSGAKRRVGVPVESVVLLGKVLHDQGHTEKFVKAAKRAGMSLTMHAGSVKFVKKFVAKNNLQQSADGQIDPFQRDPFEMFKNGG
jgi:hypothetical protein